MARRGPNLAGPGPADAPCRVCGKVVHASAAELEACVAAERRSVREAIEQRLAGPPSGGDA